MQIRLHRQYNKNVNTIIQDGKIIISPESLALIQGILISSENEVEAIRQLTKHLLSHSVNEYKSAENILDAIPVKEELVSIYVVDEDIEKLILQEYAFHLMPNHVELLFDDPNQVFIKIYYTDLKGVTRLFGPMFMERKIIDGLFENDKDGKPTYHLEKLKTLINYITTLSNVPYCFPPEKINEYITSIHKKYINRDKKLKDLQEVRKENGMLRYYNQMVIDLDHWSIDSYLMLIKLLLIYKNKYTTNLASSPMPLHYQFVLKLLGQNEEKDPQKQNITKKQTRLPLGWEKPSDKRIHCLINEINEYCAEQKLAGDPEFLHLLNAYFSIYKEYCPLLETVVYEQLSFNVEPNLLIDLTHINKSIKKELEDFQKFLHKIYNNDPSDRMDYEYYKEFKPFQKHFRKLQYGKELLNNEEKIQIIADFVRGSLKLLPYENKPYYLIGQAILDLNVENITTECIEILINIVKAGRSSVLEEHKSIAEVKSQNEIEKETPEAKNTAAKYNISNLKQQLAQLHDKYAIVILAKLFYELSPSQKDIVIDGIENIFAKILKEDQWYRYDHFELFDVCVKNEIDTKHLLKLLKAELSCLHKMKTFATKYTSASESVSKQSRIITGSFYSIASIIRREKTPPQDFIELIQKHDDLIDLKTKALMLKHFTPEQQTSFLAMLFKEMDCSVKTAFKDKQDKENKDKDWQIPFAISHCYGYLSPAQKQSFVDQIFQVDAKCIDETFTTNVLEISRYCFRFGGLDYSSYKQLDSLIIEKLFRLLNAANKCKVKKDAIDGYSFIFGLEEIYHELSDDTKKMLYDGIIIGLGKNNDIQLIEGSLKRAAKIFWLLDRSQKQEIIDHVLALLYFRHRFDTTGYEYFLSLPRLIPEHRKILHKITNLLSYEERVGFFIHLNKMLLDISTEETELNKPRDYKKEITLPEHEKRAILVRFDVNGGRNLLTNTLYQLHALNKREYERNYKNKFRNKRQAFIEGMSKSALNESSVKALKQSSIFSPDAVRFIFSMAGISKEYDKENPKNNNAPRH